MENNRIHTFPKGINARWNANSLISGLNSGPSVHFEFICISRSANTFGKVTNLDILPSPIDK